MKWAPTIMSVCALALPLRTLAYEYEDLVTTCVRTGLEHVFLYTNDRSNGVDITTHNTVSDTGWNTASVVESCNVPDVHLAHCHLIDAPHMLIPSHAEDQLGGDIMSLMVHERACAKVRTALNLPPITHVIVAPSIQHVVEYRISPLLLASARNHAHAERKRTSWPRTQQMRQLGAALSIMDIMELYKSIVSPFIIPALPDRVVWSPESIFAPYQSYFVVTDRPLIAE